MQCEDICGLSKAELQKKDEHFIRESAEQIVQSMSHPERNKFVNENIVLTTIEFQNRIQHIFKLLKIKGFIDTTNKYRLDDSFIRIEHQVRAYYFKNKPICYSFQLGVFTRNYLQYKQWSLESLPHADMRIVIIIASSLRKPSKLYTVHPLPPLTHSEAALDISPFELKNSTNTPQM